MACPDFGRQAITVGAVDGDDVAPTGASADRLVDCRGRTAIVPSLAVTLAVALASALLMRPLLIFCALNYFVARSLSLSERGTSRCY